MSSKGFKQSRHIGLKVKLARDLHKADDVHLHNRQGGGALPLPSQLGWGVRKAKKDRISLFNPWREP